MLVTQQTVFKNFWYPVIPSSHLLEQPQIVLWLDDSGNPTVAGDRCCHRSAQLSNSKVIEGNIVCLDNYPNGLVHIIVNTATPINDSFSQIVFCWRNDTEAETTAEDKAVLKTTDYNLPLDIKLEQHTISDRAGILMRRKLSRLLASDK